jgi:peptide deformylase
MVRPIVYYPNKVLFARCKPVTAVTPEVRELAADMIETMHDASGVGLAAPQVAVDLQLAVIDVSHNPQCVSFFRFDGQDADMVSHMPIVFTNPKIEPLSKEKAIDEEGCLSFPDLRGKIQRPSGIKVTYQTLEGETHVIETDGLLARAFQHETDHLNGILFIDRMSSVAKLSLKRKLRELMPEWAAAGGKSTPGQVQSDE